MFGFKTKKTNDIDAQALAGLLSGNEQPILVDVRTPDEFKLGHIKGSRLLPLSVLPVRYHELPRDKTIVLVCRSGARSRNAYDFLKRQGFQNLINLDRGLLGWDRRGFALAR